MNPLPAPNFAHLLSLRGPHGTFEHAKLCAPRIEHGYCTDDVARVALVLARQDARTLSYELGELLWSSLHFLELAQGPTGEFRNRRRSSGEWETTTSSGDWWGRAMWALGTMYARCEDRGLRERAGRAFGRGAFVRSPWPRSMAFAALGAVEYLHESPDDLVARHLLGAGVTLLHRENLSSRWRWPEDRLTYANAVLAEALIAGGSHLGREDVVQRGLDQLAWLLDAETPLGHLSVTPATGRGPGDAATLFDQQPIEVAAMADACVRALGLTGDPQWRRGRQACETWFTGANDLNAVMFDPLTGGGYDGLTINGPNLNQGAESTLALLSTQQHAHHVAMSVR
jgi:hypothetical protein